MTKIGTAVRQIILFAPFTRAFALFMIAWASMFVAVPDAAAVIPTPAPGAPRPWEPELSVSTYSTLNLQNGNCFTVIPVLSWSGRGPSVLFNLYHSSASVSEATIPVTAGMGFDLGPGWSTSYSSQIYTGGPPIEAMVIEDDGTRNVFTFNGSVWVAPAGVYDTLVQTQNPDGWTLTRKDQSYRLFDANGLLIVEGDSSGNELTITRDTEANNYRILIITDGTQPPQSSQLLPRPLVFNYDATSGALLSIFDPYDGDFNAVDRTWTLTYDIDDRLATLSDIEDRPYDNGFTYDSNGRLATVSDYEGRTYTYVYFGNNKSFKLQQMTDPAPTGGGTALAQSFDYPHKNSSLASFAEVTDRRSKLWRYNFGLTTPILLNDIDPAGQQRDYIFDSANNLVTFTDELDNVWVFSHDARGNLLTATDPLTHAKTWTYDGFNNMTSFKDALLNVTTFTYDTAGPDPTKLTKITEPADGQGNPVADTLLTYYDAANHPEWTGNLATVTDANTNGGVVTEYTYDDWGQPDGERQGPAGAGGFPVIDAPDIDTKCSFDSMGRPRGCCNREHCADIEYGHPWTGGGQAAAQTSGCGNTGRRPSCSRCAPRVQDDQPPPFAPPSDPFAPPTPEGWPAVWDCGDFEIFTPSNSTAQYTAMGEPFETKVFGIEAGVGTRQYQWMDGAGNPAIDEFGRPLSMAITSIEEWGGGVSRTLTYIYNDAAGIYTRTDQDGVVTTTTLDDLNRVSQVSMVNGAQSMTVDYAYYANGLVQSITYSNGTHILYEYDAAGRVTRMLEEKSDSSQWFRNITYEYADNDWLLRILEKWPGGTGGFLTESSELEAQAAPEPPGQRCPLRHQLHLRQPGAADQGSQERGHRLILDRLAILRPELHLRPTGQPADQVRRAE